MKMCQIFWKDGWKKFYNQYTSKLYKTSNYKTISIGDSENDIEMLNYSDYSGIVKREDGKKIRLNKYIKNRTKT